MCKDNDKPRLLEDHLTRVDEKRVIVFVNTKNHCDAVSRQLDNLGFTCTVLHGGKTQARSCMNSEQCYLPETCSQRLHTACPQPHGKQCPLGTHADWSKL